MNNKLVFAAVLAFAAAAQAAATAATPGDNA